MFDIAHFCATRLWTAYVMSGGNFALYESVFESETVTRLPLPIYGDDQEVTLVHGTEFERTNDRERLAKAYNVRPRTRVYESVQSCQDNWCAYIATRLSLLAGCRVTCSIYESVVNDGVMVPHYDDWTGIIFQLRGAKNWHVDEDGAQNERSRITQAGDVMVLPTTVKHWVSTPDYSVHAAFAVMHGKPL